MKRTAAALLVLVAIALVAVGGIAWNKALRAPPLQLEPMPAHLIALDSPAGQALLADAEAVADHDDLTRHFVPQSRRAFCGVATALTTLNAANVSPAPLDEARLFADPDVRAHPLKVSFIGMSLTELAELLRAHGAQVTVVQASDSDLAQFREIARSNLAREGDYLLVNYQRSQVGQPPMGHISPLAAYDADSDRLLVLDVAAHRYPPTWVALETMWNAMRAPLNPETTTTRGFLVVHRDTALAAN